MSNYVKPNEQLIVELYVRNLKLSIEFYERLGFEVARNEGDFAVLRWEDSQLFLEEVKDGPDPDQTVGNIRIMVSNVDHYWALSQKIGAQVIRPIEDRYYGLRDFTIAGPDGLGLRFATRLSEENDEL